MASDIVSETFTGNEKPEGFDASIRDAYAEAESQYYRVTPVGGANKEEIRQVISAPVVEKAPDEPTCIAPERESDDYPTLASWYSGFSFAEHYRKVVLAQCREIERAKAALSEDKKPSEAKLDDRARLNPIYLAYLAKHLKGRAEWENAFLQQGGMR